MIVGVAVKTPDDSLIIKLPKPNRHHNCFEFAEQIGIKFKGLRLGMPADCQGFYTHTGKYLTREAAFKYVRKIKQPVIGTPKKYLFSEDLW